MRKLALIIALCLIPVIASARGIQNWHKTMMGLYGAAAGGGPDCSYGSGDSEISASCVYGSDDSGTGDINATYSYADKIVLSSTSDITYYIIRGGCNTGDASTTIQFALYDDDGGDPDFPGTPKTNSAITLTCAQIGTGTDDNIFQLASKVDDLAAGTYWLVGTRTAGSNWMTVVWDNVDAACSEGDYDGSWAVSASYTWRAKVYGCQ